MASSTRKGIVRELIRDLYYNFCARLVEMLHHCYALRTRDRDQMPVVLSQRRKGDVLYQHYEIRLFGTNEVVWQRPGFKPAFPPEELMEGLKRPRR